MKKLTSLEVTVLAINEANSFINSNIQNVIEQVRPFIGKKIITNSGYSTKFKINLPKLEQKKELYYVNIHTWLEKTIGGSLWLNIKTCINGGSYEAKPSTAFCQYVNESIYIGQCNQGMLESICEKELSKKFDQIDIEAIKLQIKQFEEHNKANNDLYHAIPALIRETQHIHK